MGATIIPGDSVVIWLDSVEGAMVLKEAVDEAVQRVIDTLMGGEE